MMMMRFYSFPKLTQTLLVLSAWEIIIDIMMITLSQCIFWFDSASFGWYCFFCSWYLNHLLFITLDKNLTQKQNLNFWVKERPPVEIFQCSPQPREVSKRPENLLCRKTAPACHCHYNDPNDLMTSSLKQCFGFSHQGGAIVLASYLVLCATHNIQLLFWWGGKQLLVVQSGNHADD